MMVVVVDGSTLKPWFHVKIKLF